MAYQTYTTEAIVCGTFNRNTADRSYLLFTREAGMLYADAKSAREERSRQRMSLQDFSYIRVSLVKGKSSWKIGSVEPRGNFFMDAVDKAARGSVATITRGLRRFYGGQEAASALFDYLREAFEVAKGEVATRAAFEKIVLARLLLELGYVDGRLLPSTVHESPVELAQKTLEQTVETDLTPIIDKAVSLSHL
jgi:recombinational DNA repair protein (RecF pathway)